MVFYECTPIHYSTTGNGRVIVLIHGFMESLEIWQSLIPTLSEHYQVIAIDLPGHGKTPVLGQVHTMEEMAGVVQAVLTAEDISRAVFVGHSMGGYVALALVEQNPNFFSGLCLLHSTATEDTLEKKENRLRSIEAAEKNYSLFISSGVKKLFNSHSLDRLQEEIDFTKKIARSNPVDGITAALHGMRLRKDRQSVLKETDFPKLLLIGIHDLLLEPQELHAQTEAGCEMSCAEIPTGHMGQLEAPGEVLTLLKGFMALVKK
ncbi:MAG: alpha/beta hydrolase [Flavobacteriales bacterium]